MEIVTKNESINKKLKKKIYKKHLINRIGYNIKVVAVTIASF